MTFLLYIFTLVLSGCFAEHSYQFAYELEQVTTLSIVTEDSIFVLPDEAVVDFLNDLQRLPCQNYWNDPSCSIGKPYIVVTYCNGAQELISSSANCVTTNSARSYGREYFDNRDFDVLINKYLNAE